MCIFYDVNPASAVDTANTIADNAGGVVADGGVDVGNVLPPSTASFKDSRSDLLINVGGRKSEIRKRVESMLKMSSRDINKAFSYVKSPAN